MFKNHFPFLILKHEAGNRGFVQQPLSLSNLYEMCKKKHFPFLICRKQENSGFVQQPLSLSNFQETVWVRPVSFNFLTLFLPEPPLRKLNGQKTSEKILTLKLT